jgi:AcrR family transcriptional regulator
MTTLNHDEVLDAALEQVVADGPRRFSVSRLASRFGVVKSALYYHFPGGKAELVDAVFSRAEAVILGAGEAALARSGTTRERLEALLVASSDQAMRLARLYGLGEAAAEDIDEHLLGRRRAFQAKQREQIAVVVREGVARGELRRVDAELVAAALQGALQSVVRALAPRPDSDAESAVRTIVDVVFLGIAAGRQQ